MLPPPEFPCSHLLSLVSILSPLMDSGGRESGLELSTSRHGLLASAIDTSTPTPMTPSGHISSATITSASNAVTSTVGATTMTAPIDAVASGYLAVTAALVPAPTVQMRGIVALQGIHSLDNNNHSKYHMGSGGMTTDLPGTVVNSNNSSSSSSSASSSSSSLMKLFVGEIPSPPTSPIRVPHPPPFANTTVAAVTGKASVEGGTGMAAGSVDIVTAGMGTGIGKNGVAGGEAVLTSEDRDKVPLLPAINRQVVSCMLLTLEFERR